MSAVPVFLRFPLKKGLMALGMMAAAHELQWALTSAARAQVLHFAFAMSQTLEC